MDKEFEKRIRDKRYLTKVMEPAEAAKFINPVAEEVFEALDVHSVCPAIDEVEEDS